MTHKTIRSESLFSRLPDFFKRLFRKPEPRQGQQPLYKRDFNRFPMEFAVMVNLVDKDGAVIRDAAELRDISGSGAFFVSALDGRYHMGQSVALTIYLAGTDDVGARVRVEGSVVRIQPTEGGPFGDKAGKTGIAVKFNETFSFERMDKTANGDL